MNQAIKFGLIALFAIFLTACGKRGDKDEKKQAALEEQSEQQEALKKQIADLQEQIKAAEGNAAKITELQAKLTETQELLDLPRKYIAEYQQALEACNEIAKTPNADPAKVSAAETKIKEIKDKILNEKRVVIPAAFPASLSCSYEQRQAEEDKPQEVDDDEADDDNLQWPW